jgi:hypothetical protein
MKLILRRGPEEVSRDDGVYHRYTDTTYYLLSLEI